MDRSQLDRIVQQYLDGRCSDDDADFLENNHPLWIDSLWRLLEDADRALEQARQSVRGPERAAVLNDLEDECERIDELLSDLAGPLTVAGPDPEAVVVGTAQLQLSWSAGQIIVWAGGHEAEPCDLDALKGLLESHDGTAIAWLDNDPVDILGRGEAASLASPLTSALGWILGFGTVALDDKTLGTSARWFGLAAAFAVELVAQGRMVPQLEQFRGGRRSGRGGLGTYHVRWAASVMDRDRLDALADAAPGAAMSVSDRKDRKEFAGAVVADLTDAITRIAAEQIEVPAAPEQPSTKNDVGETILCRLEGSAFQAPPGIANDIVQRMGRWAQSVTGTANMRLMVKLNPPDEDDAWLAEVLAPGGRSGLEPVEVAMATASQTKSKTINRQIQRLERLFPALLRPGGRRRGEVILSQEEAWQLMSDMGSSLVTAGFDVSVPALSRKKTAPTLRLTTESTETVVGAQQLADVRWSAVFGDVELSAADIAQLASEARPMVKSQGEWIELDKVDLAAAAQALAERADKTKMSGAEMLRHALGLEGNPFGGQMSIAGQGWAADLLRSLKTLPEEPDPTPPGFAGELRSYQADAHAWLNFLVNAGLGGCLALDMGLGKTPTTLASLGPSRIHGPALVIAPPAVVGNWASEARKFMPDLKVLVHHGQNRRKADEFLEVVGDVDIVITTYGTAVRDIDVLEQVRFGKAVIDEAQAIKNPAAETSRQLRRIDAHTRLALTGTPIENGLGDLWSILDWANPGMLGPRAQFVAQLSPDRKTKEENEGALSALNGILVYRRTKAEPEIAAELPDRIDELDHCAMTPEQIGLYQAVINDLTAETAAADVGTPARKGAVLAAITALKQICNHPLNYNSDDEDLTIHGRSGKLARLNEIVETVFSANERMLVFTHFASWGERLAGYLTERTGTDVHCYHGGLSRGARDRMVEDFQALDGPGILVLSLKAGGTGLNLTAASHVVLYDRWWNPAVEDQARDRVWRIGQTKTVICHRLICPGTIDERVEEVVAGKRQVANIVLPKSSSVGDLDAAQLQVALGLDPELLMDYEEHIDEPLEPDPADESSDADATEPVGASQ